jgi:5-formyltetrahydrofolate cyclo-ligase
MTIDAEKQDVRERVWRLMRERRVARFPGADGRIPNFVGAESAARLLATSDVWRGAKTLKCNPDAPQLPVRAAALADGKVVYMAVPRLREARPFLRLNPARLWVKPREAASIGGAGRHGEPVTVRQVRRVDLVVCGTVAINPDGARIGKGGGYSDLEFALLTEAGRIDERTTIATTVHQVQLVDEELPETGHDFRVDVIVTPDEIIETGADRRKRPRSIRWSDLDEERIASIPALRGLRRT